MGDRLRYGIVGSGMMGIEHLLNLAHVPGAEVTAIADPHEGSRNRAREAAPDGRIGRLRMIAIREHRFPFLPSKELRIGSRSGGRHGVTSTVVTDDRVRWEGFHHGSSYLEHLDFLDACRRGSAPAVSLDDGLWSVAVGAAAELAIAERRSVELAEVL